MIKFNYVYLKLIKLLIKLIIYLFFCWFMEEYFRGFYFEFGNRLYFRIDKINLYWYLEGKRKEKFRVEKS
jgi:hypothetical protein